MASQGFTRKRTGCWTCKRRGYRCDETKPACDMCRRLSIKCEGYSLRLKWTEGTKRRRRPQKVKNVALADESRIATIKSSSEYFSLSPQRFSFYPSINSKNMFLLQHYYYTISGLLSSTEDKSINTYNCIILPMAFSSSGLLYTILSLSATHLSSRFEDFIVHAIYYKGLALQSLIAQVGEQHHFDELTLATVIMLSIHEVFDGSPENWLKHLGGVASMLSALISKSSTAVIASSTRMLLDIFAYHDVLASMSRRRSPLVPSYYKSAWSAFSGRKTAFLASVESILSLTAQLSTLNSLFETENFPSLLHSPYCEEALSLGHQLETWSVPEGTPDDMSNTAEAMRYAALLYLKSSLECDNRSGQVRENVTTILKYLNRVPVESASVASHVWPLYMAGCLVEDAASQEYIRDRLVAMKRLRGTRSIDRVKERLEAIWGGSVPVTEDLAVILL